jgi:hypothetical protein
LFTVPVQMTVALVRGVPWLVAGVHAASAPDTGISITHPTPSATAELLPSKNFRATHPSNDSARIRLARIALRGRRYANLRFLSLTGAELTLSPHWTGPNSMRLFADHCFCATGFGRDRGD